MREKGEREKQGGWSVAEGSAREPPNQYECTSYYYYRREGRGRGQREKNFEKRHKKLQNRGKQNKKGYEKRESYTREMDVRQTAEGTNTGMSVYVFVNSYQATKAERERSKRNRKGKRNITTLCHKKTYERSKLISTLKTQKKKIKRLKGDFQTLF